MLVHFHCSDHVSLGVGDLVVALIVLVVSSHLKENIKRRARVLLSGESVSSVEV